MLQYNSLWPVRNKTAAMLGDAAVFLLPLDSITLASHQLKDLLL